MTEEDHGPVGGDNAIDGEIVPGEAPAPPDAQASWLALISNYTERPDLFLAEVEKHDPGFTKRMNEDARKRASATENARFNFSKVQAYTTLAVSVVAAGAILFAIVYTAVSGDPSFWSVLALGVVYAITQGGSLGFEKIIDGLREILGKGPKE